MFYNYFNKLVTGLGLNRAIFKGETPPQAPEMSEDQANVKDVYAETQKKGGELAKKAAEAAGKPLEPKYTRPDYGKDTVQMRTASGYVDTGMKHEEALKGEPEKTPAERAMEIAKQIEGKQAAEAELASLGLGEKSTNKPMSDDEFFAMLDKKSPAGESEYAALEQKPEEMEFSPAEVALGNFETMVKNPAKDIVKMSKVLAKVTDKISSSIATTGQINEVNATKGFTGADLDLAQIYVTFAQDAYEKHAVWLQGGATGNEVAQVIYSGYLKDVFKKSGMNMAYLGGIFKADMPNLTV